MNRVLLGSVALLAVITGVHAADFPGGPPVLRAPVGPPAYDWTSFYIGIEGGWALGKSRHDALGLPVTNDYNLSGGLIGGTAGFNMQYRGMFFGLEGDLSWSDKKGSGPGIPPFNPNASSQTKEKWLGTGRARFGVATTDLLLYATGGFAAADIEARVTNAVTGFNATDTQTRWGWTAGTGIEAGLTRNWSLKMEYLYVRFQDSQYFNPAPVGLEIRDNVPVYDHIVRLGLNYRFNWASPVVARY